MTQPGGYIAGAGIVAAPPNHMVLSILTCLFCFWPLGLVAIIKSNEVCLNNLIIFPLNAIYFLIVL